MQIIKTVTLDYRQYLTEKEISEIEHEVTIMETRESAGIEALKIVQSHRGWISDDSLNAIAQLLAISSAQLEGVATFYNLIYRQPVGRFVIHICDSISCHLNGYQKVLHAIKTHLGIDYGQTTEDGLFTLLSNVCLGGCDKAPVMMIGQQHYEYLTSEKAVAILNGLSQSTDGNSSGDFLDKAEVGATIDAKIVEVKND
ncbi:MAG: NADH-quinone oxidoreductase subunit NuoE [Alteromonadaceae bacterium]|nr:NADH-quinone oxidoreductase subunit NuoE [Alteromonadaceae bacterium]